MKDTTIEEKGYAKINLALHVTGVQANGYHLLDSIVIFTDIFDRLFIKKNSKSGLTFTGQFSKLLNVKKNTISRVLKLFENVMTDSLSIKLEKNLGGINSFKCFCKGHKPWEIKVDGAFGQQSHIPKNIATK